MILGLNLRGFVNQKLLETGKISGYKNSNLGGFGTLLILPMA